MSPEDRLDALRNAPPDGWVAFSSDETRLVAYGVTYEEAVTKADQNGERDPVLVKVPKDWSMQVLSTVPVMFSYWAKPADALDLSRRLNDHIAAVVREHPKRFAGLATLPMQDPDLAAGELERCVRELGLRGAEIGTHVDANPHS